MLSFDATAASSRRFHQAESLLSGLPQAMMIVLLDRRLQFANASAQRMFLARQATQWEQRLTGIGQLTARRIEDLLQRSAAGHPAPEGLWFSPDLRTGRLEILAVERLMNESADWHAGSLLLIVHFDEPALSQGARIGALCQQCALTSTERYVLLLLADGLTAEASARHLGLKVSTLRTHIRSLLGKTQAATLMQLLRWLGSGAHAIQ